MLKIAQVLKSNGTDGELVLGFKDIAPEEIDIEEPVFICFDGLPVPFFIRSFAFRGAAKALVKLTGINSYDDAEEIVGQPVFIINDDSEDDASSEGLVGWTVKDSDNQTVGTVSDYIDIPGNPCIEVKTNAGEKLLPLHDDLIVSLDEEAKVIVMSLPSYL